MLVSDWLISPEVVADENAIYLGQNGAFRDEYLVLYGRMGFSFITKGHEEQSATDDSNWR